MQLRVLLRLIKHIIVFINLRKTFHLVHSTHEHCVVVCFRLEFVPTIKYRRIFVVLSPLFDNAHLILFLILPLQELRE